MQIAEVDNAQGPCAGYKVVDFSGMVSGPLCSQSLGDLGADVIKVESLSGDTSRVVSQPVRDGVSGFFSQLNRNKRAISIDLKNDQGKAIARRLVQKADVVIENFFESKIPAPVINWKTFNPD